MAHSESMADTPVLCADLQLADDLCSTSGVPTQASIEAWAGAALSLAGYDKAAEISIRIVDLEESQQLNRDYRDKNKPTNVLSFPSELPEELNIPLLGDLVICAPVVATEATQQQKTLDSHWAHMVVHGTLHLLGYDHIDDADAAIMENLETRILTGLGFPEPYDSEWHSPADE